MDNKIIGAEKVIQNLTPSIDKKCAEIKAQRKDKIQTRLFALMCVFAVIIPVVFVIFGISLAIFVAPILFMSICVIVLLPAIINVNGGRKYEPTAKNA